MSKQADVMWTPKVAAALKTRVKPKPTNRSKKNRKLTWSCRGSMPHWMRMR
ncbi:DNA-binding protein H-NS [Bradyrhizobium sp. LB8.2]|uniref:hypothetical protein n=1 Tax=Bradyrhizobium sp. LB8.2 TaxID=3156330 RepID=UPI003399633B